MKHMAKEYEKFVTEKVGEKVDEDLDELSEGSTSWSSPCNNFIY